MTIIEISNIISKIKAFDNNWDGYGEDKQSDLVINNVNKFLKLEIST